MSKGIGMKPISITELVLELAVIRKPRGSVPIFTRGFLHLYLQICYVLHAFLFLFTF